MKVFHLNSVTILGPFIIALFFKFALFLFLNEPSFLLIATTKPLLVVCRVSFNLGAALAQKVLHPSTQRIKFKSGSFYIAGGQLFFDEKKN